MGVLAVLAVVLVEAGRSLFGAFGVGDAPADTAAAARGARRASVSGCSACSTISSGTQADHGFRGHLGALAHGRVTTGAVKIVGGGRARASCSSARVAPDASGARVVADALLVALAANLANLFDRAPGRAIKIGLLAWIPIALVARADSVGVAIAPVVGAFAGLLGDDLHERLMLGDTGSNVIGAVLGLAVVLECSTATRTVVLGGARRVHRSRASWSRSAGSSSGCLCSAGSTSSAAERDDAGRRVRLITENVTGGCYRRPGGVGVFRRGMCVGKARLRDRWCCIEPR